MPPSDLTTPPLPRRIELAAVSVDYQAVMDGPVIFDPTELAPAIPTDPPGDEGAHRTTPESVVVVGRPATHHDEAAIAIFDGLTHAHHDKLEHFRLEVVAHPTTGDLWHLGAFALPQGLRCGAGFLMQETFDPRVGRTRESWRHALGHAVEPLWPQREICSGYSVLALPGADPQPHTDNRPADDEIVAPDADTVFRSPDGIEFQVQLVRPRKQRARRLLIVFDGDRFSRPTKLLPALWEAHSDVAIAFVDVLDKANRATWLTPDGEVTHCLIHQVMPWLERVHGDCDPRRTIVAGSSLGGLSTAHIVRTHPDVIGGGIIQSASWWWPGAGARERQEWEHLDLPPHSRIVYEYGSFEVSATNDHDQVATLLRRRLGGSRARATSWVGGHDHVCWRGGIIQALDFLD